MVLVSLSLCLCVVFAVSAIALVESFLLAEPARLAADANPSLSRQNTIRQDVELQDLPDAVVFIAT